MNIVLIENDSIAKIMYINKDKMNPYLSCNLNELINALHNIIEHTKELKVIIANNVLSQYPNTNYALKWHLLINRKTIRLLHNAINFLKRYKGIYNNYTEIYNNIIFR